MSKCYRGEPSQLTGWLVYDAVTTIAILCVTEKSLPADCRAVMAVVIASWLRVLAVLFSSPGEEGFACLSRIGEEIQWNEACGVYIYLFIVSSIFRHLISLFLTRFHAVMRVISF